MAARNQADAGAICEAVTRANMRFVATKTLEQQSCLMLHRTRHLFIRQQTAVINAIRAHLAEFGIVAPRRNGVEQLLDVVAIQVTNGYPTSHVRALPLLAPSCGCSRPGYWSLWIILLESTVMRRTRSPCCARAASGHAATAPPSSVMNSRRLVCRERSIVRGDEDRIMIRPSSRPEARSLQAALAVFSSTFSTMTAVS
jgi:hypothetical protein